LTSNKDIFLAKFDKEKQRLRASGFSPALFGFPIMQARGMPLRGVGRPPSTARTALQGAHFRSEALKKQGEKKICPMKGKFINNGKGDGFHFQYFIYFIQK